jgi:hypothetical protein
MKIVVTSTQFPQSHTFVSQYLTQLSNSDGKLYTGQKNMVEHFQTRFRK